MRPRAATGIAIALGAIVLCGAAPAAQSGGPPAASQGALHDRATRAGGQLTDVLADDGSTACASAAELAARSPVIVIGQALAQRGHLVDGGRTIATDVV